jgi:hypothetical protein
MKNNSISEIPTLDEKNDFKPIPGDRYSSPRRQALEVRARGVYESAGAVHARD